MKHTNLSELVEIIDFVNSAKEHFEKDNNMRTFTINAVDAGCLFAVRWGLGDDCVLVFKLDENFEPLIFGQAINKEEN